MPTDTNTPSPSDGSSRPGAEAATEILRMLTSDGQEPASVCRADAGDPTTQRSLRQDTTMWF